MRIVFMGTPEFAVESLNALIKAGNDVCAVVTVPDKPAGRGLLPRKSEVKKFAEVKGLPVLQPVKLKDENFISELRKFNADLFVVVAFKLLPEVIWQMPKKGTINLHASLLPDYRGAAPINWAIINGEKITGITTFFIEKEIDIGKIIHYEEVSINETDNAGVLHNLLMKKGAGLLVKTVNSIEKENYQPISQQQLIVPGKKLKTAPKITRNTCKINWKLKVNDIYNHIRGLSPYPAAWTFLENKSTGKNITIKIFSAEIIDGRHNSAFGEIISDGNNYMYITCDGGIISITELQSEGRKRMCIADFLRGFRRIDEWKIIQ